MIKLLIVDDSATVRSLLKKGLSQDPEIEVVGTAGNPFEARDLISKTDPDVITLDVEMPRMDGIEFLQRIMASHPIPVIMVSGMTERGKQLTLEALASGAVDFQPKPSGSGGRKGLEEMVSTLAQKIRAASKARVHLIPRDLKALSSRFLTGHSTEQGAPLVESRGPIIAIGASTGGTVAIPEVLKALPSNFPGVVLVQHISPGFTQSFSQRLAISSGLRVREAQDGDRVIDGQVLVGPSLKQMKVRSSGKGGFFVECRSGAPVGGHCPSVDVLFHSVAQAAGRNAIGVILTGMGHDGGDGLLAMKAAGAMTLGQDEATCVVFGMPKVAFEKGAVEKVLPLGNIGAEIKAFLQLRNGSEKKPG